MAIAARYKGYRYPIEVIGHAVWLYHRFALSLRDVEELMLARGVVVSYKRSGVLACEVRAGLRCPVTSAATPPRRQMALRRGLREDQRYHPLSVARGRPARQRARHLGAVAPQRSGGQAVFRKLLKGLRYVPRVIVTDKLASYQLAHRELLPSVTHRRSKYLNNRAENSHQPTRVRERVMKRFASPGQAQRFSCLRSATSDSTFVPVVI